MPSLSTARRASAVITNGAKTIGEIHKENADWAIEQTWENDIQSKVAYIYDYMHDDQPQIKDHMTYKNTTKTRIDIKLIVKNHSALDQDQPEFYCQFKPSQKLEFEENDELYYFETEYHQRYGTEFPIGMMLDIPDDKGVYRKWLICEKEIANQFPKYLILPITYQFMWIEKDSEKIYKRKMWGVNRSQKSYTIGTYTDRYITRPDNQAKALLPLNPITEGLWYTGEDDKNMRIVVSAKTKHPIVWKLTKVENTTPLGVQTLTFYQNYWDPYKDYIEYSDSGEIIGMWADYYSNTVEPSDPNDPSPVVALSASISTSTPTIKIGGGYKTLTVTIINNSGEDITSTYSDANYEWTCCIEDADFTNTVSWRDGASFNQKKIRYPNNSSRLGRILFIGCTVTKDSKVIKSETLQLEISE